MCPRNLQTRDLLLSVDRSRPGSLARQVEEQMRTAIRSEAYAAGAELPSTRVLAEDLGVSRGVIVRAYSQLAAEGYLALRQGATVTVRGAVRVDPKTDRRPADGHRVIYDLRPHLPEITGFPRQPWLRAVRESLELARSADLTYTDPGGLWDLRVEVANYLARARGVVAAPERTLITGGSTHALSLMSRVLARRGRSRIAFENPSHPLLRGVAAAGGQTVVAAAVDQQGVVPESIGTADTVCVTPAHQFPTGVVLSPERRLALVAWAEETDALIVEDDYDAEFRYDRAPVGALQGLAPDRVVYVGSTGKTFAPALRLGWAVLPEGLFDEVSQELFSSVLQISGLNQLAFSSFLRRGDFDRHLRRMRQVYRSRRDLVASLLGELLPDHSVSGISAGLHVVLEMPSHTAAAAARREAEQAGILVELLEGHAFADYSGGSGLLIGYGGISEPSLERATRRLVKIIQATG